MALERLVRVFCILKKNMQEHTGSMQIVFPNTHICYTQFMNSPDLLNYGFLLKNIDGPPGRLLGLLGRQGPSLFSNHWSPSAHPSTWYWVGDPNKWRDFSDSLHGWYCILEGKANLSLSLSEMQKWHFFKEEYPFFFVLNICCNPFSLFLSPHPLLTNCDLNKIILAWNPYLPDSKTCAFSTIPFCLSLHFSWDTIK